MDWRLEIPTHQCKRLIAFLTTIKATILSILQNDTVAHGIHLVMKLNVDFVGLLKPLFDIYHVPMNPADQSKLKLFESRASERSVPPIITAQLLQFYSVVNGVPCLDSLHIHPCHDSIIFEWWDQRELWLGQRDCNALWWSSSKKCFCLGDAGNMSFSKTDEFSTFYEALVQMVRLFD